MFLLRSALSEVNPLKEKKNQKSIITHTVARHSRRFRPHPGEGRPVVGADVAVGDGGQEAECGADRQGTLG